MEPQLLESPEILAKRKLLEREQAYLQALATFRQQAENGRSFDSIMSSLERSLIDWAMTRARGNQTRAAEVLEIKRDRLRYLMKKYNIPTQRKRGQPAKQG